MGTYTVSATRTIPGPSQAVYDVLADYEVGHPSILPKPYFERIVILEGGIGEGTVFTADIKVPGGRQTIKMMVSEPEPGSWLRETDAAAGMETDFRLEPTPDGRSTILTIRTVARAHPGFKGWMERIFSPIFLRKLYRLELDMLQLKFMRQG